MSTVCKQAGKAVVVVRSQHSVGNWVWLSRIYLLRCEVDDKGMPIIPARATQAMNWAYFTDNVRATRRFGKKVEVAEYLAHLINSGKLDFNDAKILFRRFDTLEELVVHIQRCDTSGAAECKATAA